MEKLRNSSDYLDGIFKCSTGTTYQCRGENYTVSYKEIDGINQPYKMVCGGTTYTCPTETETGSGSGSGNSSKGSGSGGEGLYIPPTPTPEWCKWCIWDPCNRAGGSGSGSGTLGSASGGWFSEYPIGSGLVPPRNAYGSFETYYGSSGYTSIYVDQSLIGKVSGVRIKFCSKRNISLYTVSAELKDRYNSTVSKHSGGSWSTGYGQFTLPFSPSSSNNMFNLYFSGEPVTMSWELV